MNYIGSKFKLINFIQETIHTVVGNLEDKIFCDIFAGTGIVGRSFKTQTKKVIANDCEYYSYVLNRNYIGNSNVISKSNNLIEELNNTHLIDNGFIYNNYCENENSARNYFSSYNGKKIDAVRTKIENWYESKTISEDEYYFLLCCLIESADKVANTASVYGAYLKKIKKSAQTDMVIKPALFIADEKCHDVYREDANKLIKKIEGDILYLDPPYNARQYGANYHLLNTIAEYKPFSPKGKTGLRDYEKSMYCRKNNVCETFDDLLKNADFKYIFLSYNNEGLMINSTIRSIMERYGRYNLFETTHQRFKADKTENREYKASSTIEYLHCLEKR